MIAPEKRKFFYFLVVIILLEVILVVYIARSEHQRFQQAVPGSIYDFTERHEEPNYYDNGNGYHGNQSD